MSRIFSEKSFRGKESQHHREADDNLTKVAVVVEQPVDKPIPVVSRELIQGVDYDLITATYPNLTTEIYTYTLSTVTVLTVTVIYMTTNKKDILTASFV